MGNSQKLDGGSMFGNVPRALWSRWLEPDDLGRIPLACRALLIEIEKNGETQRVLCETGIGAFFEPKMAERFGVERPDEHVLLQSLSELGLKHEDIDVVILSHLHFDHAGGLLPAHSSGDTELLFSKAKYVVGREAYSRSLDPHERDRASFIPGLSDQLQRSDRLYILEEGQKLDGFEQELSFFTSHGHTPGQLHTVVHGEKNQVVFAGDLVPGVPWLHVPVTMGYDRYPEKLIDEKKQLYNDVLSEKDWIFYTHDHQVACSRVTKNEKGRIIPVEENSNLVRFEL